MPPGQDDDEDDDALDEIDHLIVHHCYELTKLLKKRKELCPPDGHGAMLEISSTFLDSSIDITSRTLFNTVYLGFDGRKRQDPLNMPDSRLMKIVHNVISMDDQDKEAGVEEVYVEDVSVEDLMMLEELRDAQENDLEEEFLKKMNMGAKGGHF